MKDLGKGLKLGLEFQNIGKDDSSSSSWLHSFPSMQYLNRVL